MLVAENACKWRHAEDEAGLFLKEHYRCVDGIIEFCNRLSYNGKLKPCREHESPSTRAIDEQKVEAVCFVYGKGIGRQAFRIQPIECCGKERLL